jgi:tripartite-type tricarboxylate transporter receptor subunit TctC
MMETDSSASPPSRRKICRLLAGSCLGASAFVSGIGADRETLAATTPSDDFFRGKQIALLVGFNPGGTYDVYSRTIAEWLPRYLPGAPPVVVQNMPGVGGAKAANYLYSQASRDGLTIGMVSQAMALGQAIHDPTARYDASQFGWIGRVTPVVEMSVTWRTSPVKTIQDAMAHSATMASTGAGSTPYIMPLVLNRIVGTKFKLVRGYPGTTGGLLAMEQGEVEGAYATAENLLIEKPKWLKEKLVNVLVQYSQARHPAFREVPTMVELGRSEDDRKVLALFGSTAEIGRSILAPPGLSPARLATLRSGFDAMVSDPAFKAELVKRNMEFGPLSGLELQALIRRTLQISPEVAERAAKAQSPE